MTAADNFILQYAVSDKTNSNAWQSMCTTLVRIAADSKGDVEMVARTITAYEEEFKSSTGVTTLPASYRSAKSVAMKALVNGVPLLLNENGDVVPKTVLSAKIKEAVNAPVKDATYYKARFHNIVALLMREQSDAKKSGCMTHDEAYDAIREVLKNVGYI